MARPGYIESAAQTLLGKVLKIAGGLAVGVLIANSLGPAGRGRYGLFVTIVIVTTVVGRAGLQQAAMYHIAKGTAPEREIAGTVIVSGMTVSGLLSLLLFLLFGAAGVPLFDGFQGVPMVAAIVAVPFGVFRNYARLLAMGKRRVLMFNLIDWVHQYTHLALVITVSLFAPSVELFTVVYAAAAALAATFAVVGLCRMGLMSLTWQRRLMRPLLRYGAPSAVGNICRNLVLRSDMLMLGYIASDAAVGFYAVAVGLAERLFYLPSSLQTITTRWVAGSSDAVQFAGRVYRNSLAASTVAAGALMALAVPLIELLYPAFTDSIPVARILLPATLMFGLYGVMNSFHIGRGRTGLHAAVAAGGLMANLLLNLLLIPRIGFVGAAVASLVSYTAMNFAVVALYLRASGAPLSSVLLLKAQDFQAYRRAFERVRNRIRRGS